MGITLEEVGVPTLALDVEVALVDVHTGVAAEKYWPRRSLV